MESSKMTKHEERLPERVKQRVTVAPRVDVYENANELLLVADVPGATRESVSVQLEKGQLTIEATRQGTPEGTPLAEEFRLPTTRGSSPSRRASTLRKSTRS